MSDDCLRGLFANQELIKRKKFLSIEVSPNKDVSIERLKELSPAFCSIVWKEAADAPEDVAQLPAFRLAKELTSQGIEVLVHLAGRYLSEIRAAVLLDYLKSNNIRNILVLQGEISPFREGSSTSGFRYASDFIKFIRNKYGDWFYVGVAAYPKTHPSSKNQDEDLMYLKVKVDAGADFILTQMIFEKDVFRAFQQSCRKIDIKIPIIPGICAINSYESFMSIVSYCHVNVPETLTDAIEAKKDDPKVVYDFGVSFCSQLARELLSDKETIGVHFFTLNNLDFVKDVLAKINFTSFK